MIHALSRSTSSECLHFLPSHPLFPLPLSLSLSRRPLIPVLRVASAFFCPTNSILAVVERDALSIFPFPPPRRLGRGARISISMRATPKSIRLPPFNITRPPDTSLRVIRTADGEASSYQSLPLDRTCCGRKSRIIVGTRRQRPRLTTRSKIDNSTVSL